MHRTERLRPQRDGLHSRRTQHLHVRRRLPSHVRQVRAEQQRVRDEQRRLRPERRLLRHQQRPEHGHLQL
jgi:hypothetical protein